MYLNKCKRKTLFSNKVPLQPKNDYSSKGEPKHSCRNLIGDNALKTLFNMELLTKYFHLFANREK